MYSRISFLQQAATYLTISQDKELKAEFEDGSLSGKDSQALRGLARHMVTDLRSVSLKTRIRLSPAMKQTLCKFCDALLVEGQSCTTQVENQSRGGRKAWADVLVRKCHACGNVKRQPIHAQRQKSKAARLVEDKAKKQSGSMVTKAVRG
jgi:ribonuclease P protein subunit RPR2